MTETLRTFVALELPESLKEQLWALQGTLQASPAASVVRWVDPFGAHITLKFLGDTPVPQLPPIVEALDLVAERKKPITLRLGDLGAFPNVNRPDVIFVGLSEGEREVAELFSSVEAALKRLGYKPERRDYHPHITLGRIPREASQAQRSAVGELIGPTPLPDFQPVTVDAIALMRSLLTPEGSIYTRIGRSGLGEPPPLQEDDWEDIGDDEEYDETDDAATLRADREALGLLGVDEDDEPFYDPLMDDGNNHLDGNGRG